MACGVGSVFCDVFWLMNISNTYMVHLLVVYKVILGSFSAFVSKWPVAQNRLVVERK